MSTDSGQDDLPKILARALLRAWEQYCEADLGGKLSEEVARLARLFLKGFLVGRAREGMTDEGQLAVAGLQYLISLTRKPTSSKCSTKEEKTAEDGGRHLHFCINRVPAKFLFQWRIPIGDTAIRQRDQNVGTSSRNATIRVATGTNPLGHTTVH
jgi:hypothetical protein